MCIVLDSRRLFDRGKALPEMTVIVLALVLRLTWLFLLKLHVARTCRPLLHLNLVGHWLGQFRLLLLLLGWVELGLPEHPLVTRPTYLKPVAQVSCPEGVACETESLLEVLIGCLISVYQVVVVAR